MDGVVLGRGCTNRRRCQAWTLEKEAQSRPAPSSARLSLAQSSGHTSELCLPIPAEPLLLAILSTRMCFTGLGPGKQARELAWAGNSMVP